jgi:hypothetical protein
MEKHTIATSANVTELLGEIDPITMERLLATGASADEIAEAVVEVEDEDAFGEAHRVPSTPRVAQVRAILEEHVFEDLEDEFDARYDHT